MKNALWRKWPSNSGGVFGVAEGGQMDHVDVAQFGPAPHHRADQILRLAAALMDVHAVSALEDGQGLVGRLQLSPVLFHPPHARDS